jgi:hypothetical protein
MGENNSDEARVFVKIVYFDEESASDFLDISAGGKSTSSTEDVQDRLTELHGKAEARVGMKVGWLSIFGGSADAAAGVRGEVTGKTILSKTLSNTILTDYLEETSVDDACVVELRDLRVYAPKDSMAYMKMFTPYMVMLRLEDSPVDLALLDEVLSGAKGYYELLGERADGAKIVLRFNLNAFRNNYGLTDLGRMRLVFHGILVGQTSETDLGMKAEMSGGSGGPAVTASEVYHGKAEEDQELLDVYDVILAGVEHV